MKFIDTMIDAMAKWNNAQKISFIGSAVFGMACSFQHRPAFLSPQPTAYWPTGLVCGLTILTGTVMAVSITLAFKNINEFLRVAMLCTTVLVILIGGGLVNEFRTALPFLIGYTCVLFAGPILTALAVRYLPEK